MSTAATGLPWWKLKSSAHHATLSYLADNADKMPNNNNNSDNDDDDDDDDKLQAFQLLPCIP